MHIPTARDTHRGAQPRELCRKLERYRGGTNAWDGPGRGDRLMKQLARVDRSISAQVEIDGDDVIGIEAVVDRDQIRQAPHQQTGADREHHGERDLAEHQNASSA